MEDSLIEQLKNQVEEKKGWRIPENCILSHKNKNKFRWDIMVLVMAIYNSLQIPFYQAFNPPFFKWRIF